MSAPCPSLCFVVTVRVGEHAPTADALRLLADFSRLLDANGLSVRTLGLEHVVCREGSQATDSDRSLVRLWAGQWAAVADVDVGDIVDMSHGA
jgi:hypothetical protein